MTAPAASRVLVGRAVVKIRRRLDVHSARPPALTRRNRIPVTLAVEEWAALVSQLEGARDVDPSW